MGDCSLLRVRCICPLTVGAKSCNGNGSNDSAETGIVDVPAACQLVQRDVPGAVIECFGGLERSIGFAGQRLTAQAVEKALLILETIQRQL